MILKLNRSIEQRLNGIFGKYTFEVGVLEDKDHKAPKPASAGLKELAGGPARKIAPRAYGTIAAVSQINRERLGFNYLIRPFRKRSSDIIKFSNEFFKLAFGRSQAKRAVNLLQAIVRNPILRGDYGKNSAKTAKAKGFNRNMIDTGQLFKNLTAKVKVRSV